MRTNFLINQQIKKVRSPRTDRSEAITLIPSILKPRLALELMVSLHCMYRGLVTACWAFSSAVGARGSTSIIFLYMSLRSFGFSRALVNSSSRYVLQKQSHPNKTVRTPQTFLFTTYNLASRNVNWESKYYRYPSFAYGETEEHGLMIAQAYLVKQLQESGIVSFTSCSNYSFTTVACYCYVLLTEWEKAEFLLCHEIQLYFQKTVRRDHLQWNQKQIGLLKSYCLLSPQKNLTSVMCHFFRPQKAIN